ncbi:hypothetical protein C6P42_002961 [Pichia californica]|nr:hypothetical protein C6P42_002961 [[Candida] californica]
MTSSKNTNKIWNADNCIICDIPLNPITGASNCNCFNITNVNPNNLNIPNNDNNYNNNYNNYSNKNNLSENINSIPTFYETPIPPAFLNLSSNNITPDSDYHMDFNSLLTNENNSPHDETYNSNNNIDDINDTEALIRAISNLSDSSLNDGINNNSNNNNNKNIDDDNNNINNDDFINPYSSSQLTPPLPQAFNENLNSNLNLNSNSNSNSHSQLLTPIINISTLSFSDKFNDHVDNNIDYNINTNIINSNTLNANIHNEILKKSNSNKSIISNNNSFSSNNNSNDDLSLSINPSNLSIIPSSPGLLTTPKINNYGKIRHSRTFSGSSYSSDISSNVLDNFNGLKIDNKEKSSITKPNKNSSNNLLLSPVDSVFAKLSREPSHEILNLDSINKSSDKLTIKTNSNSYSGSRSSSISRSRSISRTGSRSSSISRTGSRSNFDDDNNLNIDTDADTEDNGGNSRKSSIKKKGIICETCGKYFANNGKLKSHSLTHTDIKPFKCDEENCFKAFARRSDLTRHKRTIHSSIDEKESRRQKCGGWCKGIILKRSYSNLEKQRSDNEITEDNEWYEPSIVEGEGIKWGCGDNFLRMDGLLKHWRESKLGKECLDTLISMFGDISVSLDDETKLNIAKDHVLSLKR